jgi:spectinomycin phosphotransferase
MRARPVGLNDEAVLNSLAINWKVDVVSVSYRAFGGGSYHWSAIDRGGVRYFATADDLGTKPWLGSDRDETFRGLAAGLDVARALHELGLEFVVAPIPTPDDRLSIRLDDRYCLALYPYVAGRAGQFGDELSRGDRDILCAMWARLHLATPRVTPGLHRRGLAIPGREGLETSLRDLDRAWTGGPYAERTRALVAEGRAGIAAAFEAFDALASNVASAHGELVITHGEPHGGNIVTDGTLRHLVDWDTVALALPERDLWTLDDGTENAFDAYTAATGWNVSRAALDLHRLTWWLKDIVLFVGQLRSNHSDDADTRKAWRALVATVAALDGYMPR